MSEPFPLNILTYVAEAFIGAFGITEPAPRQRRLVSLALGGFLLMVGLAAITVVCFLLWEIHLGRR
jgi:hypothetical protein